jgi:hypothetical protein
VDVDPADYENYFKRLDLKLNKLKEDHQRSLIRIFEEYTTNVKDSSVCHTSILQKT